jgi:hypothetical protein
MGGEMRRQKSLRIGVHHANAVVWGPVYRMHLIAAARKHHRGAHEIDLRRSAELRAFKVELKGVRNGVERRRGVSGLKARDPERRETDAGRECP